MSRRDMVDIQLEVTMSRSRFVVGACRGLSEIENVRWDILIPSFFSCGTCASDVAVVIDTANVIGTEKLHICPSGTFDESHGRVCSAEIDCYHKIGGMIL